MVDPLKAHLQFVLISSSEFITELVHFYFTEMIEATHFASTVGVDLDAVLSLLEVRGNKTCLRSLTIPELLELRVSFVDLVFVPA